MSIFFNAGRELVRLSLWSLIIGGCSWTAPDCSTDSIDDAGPDCEQISIGAQAIESDDGLLLGRLSPNPGDAWAVSEHAVRKGLRYDFRIRVPAALATTNLRVESSDPDVVAVAFDLSEDSCDGSFVLSGSLEYEAIGEAAIVVYDDRAELDRFTLTVRELDRIEVVASFEDGDAGAGEEVSISELTLLATTPLRLRLLSATGEELAGDEQTYWTLDDHDVASFEGETIGRAPWTRIVPVAPGATTLRVRSTGFELTIPVTVRVAPDSEADAGPDE